MHNLTLNTETVDSFTFYSTSINSKWVIIAGLSSWLALFISFYEILQHLKNFHKPHLQKYIIRILWMVPIYSMNSWFAMKFTSLTIYFDTLRECYEAFVIYSFMKYLTNFLNKNKEIDRIIDSKPPVQHIFPFNFLPPMAGGFKFLFHCRHGILQYIAIRPVTTFIALVSEIFGSYYNGSISFKDTYPYLLIVNNISQTTALYFLVLFYLNYKKELTQIKPLPKFLCIKAVIFLSFFQSCIITLLIELNIIQDNSSLNGRTTVDFKLQNFLICIEMFAASIAHLFAFSYKEFVDNNAPNQPAFYSFMNVIDFSDERLDITDHLNQVYSRIRLALKKNTYKRSSNAAYEYEILIPLTTYVSATNDASKYQSNVVFYK